MKIKKYKFMNDVYGEELEYVFIQDENEKIVIFEYYNKIHIIRYKNSKELVEQLIESRLITDFLGDTLDEQDEEIENLSNYINNKIKEQ